MKLNYNFITKLGVLSYSFFVLNFSLNAQANLDSDGDGIINSIDLDDDNDGILDEYEYAPVFCSSSPTCVANASLFSTTQGTSVYPSGWTAFGNGGSPDVSLGNWHVMAGQVSSATALFPYAPSGNYFIYGMSKNGSGTLGGWAPYGEALQQTLTCLVPGNFYTVTFKGAITRLSTWTSPWTAPTKGNFVLLRDGTQVAISQDINLEAQAQTITLTFMAVSTSHTIAIGHINPLATDLSLMVIQAGSGTFCEGTVVANNDIDTDGDGIPNRLDLDSDGDGCSDAFEGGATMNKSDSLMTSPFGANGFADNKETVAGNGQANFINTYNIYAKTLNRNACVDTDNDGIVDIYDIDDDNDGIKDGDEAGNCIAPDNTLDQLIENSNSFANCAGNIDGPGFDFYGFNLPAYTGSKYIGLHYGESTSVQIPSSSQTRLGIPYRVRLATANASITPWNSNYPTQMDVYASTASCTQSLLIGTTTLIPAPGPTGSASSWYVDEFSFTPTANYTHLTFVPKQAPSSTNFGYMLLDGIEVGYYTSTAVCDSLNDIDKDGVINSLDLDSDGDGCTDAFEGGSTLVQTDSIIAGPYGANGLANSIETAADNGIVNYNLQYSSYATSKNIATCKDFDNDGISDLIDIDDDNDGVLDATESPSCFYNASEWLNGNRIHIVPSTSLAMNATYNSLSKLDDGDNGTAVASYAVQFVATTTAQRTVYAFDMSMPVEISKIYLGYVNTNTHFNASTFLKLQGSNDNTNWTNLNDSVAYSSTTATNGITNITGVGAVNANVFNVTRNSGRYRYYRIYWTNGGGINVNGLSNEVYFEVPSNYNVNLNPKPSCGEDQDNDGVFNHSDLDSDGDGCSDAKEAGATTSTTVNFKFTGTMGTNGLDNSLETSADNGTINYTSYYYNALNNNLNGCIDTDNDAIADLIDIDDDNDGILDSEECGGLDTLFYENFETTVPNPYRSAPVYQPGVSLNGQITTNGANGTTKSLFHNTGTGTYTVGEVVWGLNNPISIKSGKSYEISFYVRENSGTTPPQLEPYINGVKQGSTILVNSTWTKYVLNYNNAGNNILNFELRNLIATASGNDLQIDEILILDLCKDLDSDNDGLINRLDIDSDGDGCSDAFEGGSTLVQIDSIIAGPYGNNGLANSKETVTDNGAINYVSNYKTYAISKNLAGCKDSDNDGVADLLDIDDDNDGVLDATESPSCFYSASEWLSGNRPQITANTSLAMNTTYNLLNKLDDGDNGTGASSYAVVFNASTNAQQTIYNFDMTMPVEISKLYLGYVNTNTHFNANTFLKLQGSNDNATWINLNDSVAYSTTTATNGITNITGVGAVNANVFSVTKNPGRYRYYRIYWTNGGGINVNGYSNEVYFETLASYQASMNPKPTCSVDTDNDGVFNHLDLDSDGDGCSDAKEAGATISTSANFKFTGTMGTNGLDNSLETSVDNGIINYASSYNFATSNIQNACLDSDGDGVGDLIDIDDDNDGIPDVTESTCENYNLNEINCDNVKGYTPTTFKSFVLNNSISGTNYLGNGDSVQVTYYGTVQSIYTASQTMTSSNEYCPVSNDATMIQFLSGAQTHVIKFSKTVVNPIINIWSLGNGSLAVYYTFTTPIKITKNNGSLVQTNTTTFYGAEGNGSIILSGAYDSIVFTANTSENWTGMQIMLGNAYGNTSATNLNNYSCVDLDTDGDGIPNRIDLDSDNDGCFDSYEGGSSLIQSDSIISGPYGANGLANSKETVADNGTINYTSVYKTYAVSKNLATCKDTDGDGVLDISDIDDDNDGILDVTESPSCFYAASEWLSGNRTQIKANTSLAMNNTYNRLNLLNDGENGSAAANYAVQFNATTTAPASVYSFDMSIPVEISKLYLGYVNGNTHFNANTFLKLQGSNDNTTWINLNDSIAYNTTTATNGITNITGVGAVNANVFSVTKNSGRYRYYRIYWTNGGGININGVSNEVYFETLASYQASMNPKPTCSVDTDNDGVFNHLDLDSDGDGCSDAKEAGATSSTTSNFKFTGTMGSNGLDNSLETSVDNGVTNYASTYLNAILLNKNGCTDTDGDGIGDLIDLDDDNDGILDIEETNCINVSNSCEVFTNSNYSGFNLVKNGGFEQGNIGFTSGYVFRTSSAGCADYFLSATGWASSVGSCSGNLAMQLNADCSANQVPFWCQEIDVTPNTNYRFGFSMRHASVSYIAFSVDGGTLSTPVPTTSNWSQKEYVINSGSKSKIQICLFETSKVSGGADFVIDDIYLLDNSMSFCNDTLDTDGDGIPNRLDLDSDNDGCSDAYEGGSSLVQSDSIIAGPYGNNGLANSKETVADNGVINYISNYSIYATSKNLAGCKDTDGDGSLDLVDIDDDNDGVLDATESPSCFYSASEWLSGNRPHITANTTLAMNTTYNLLNKLDDGDNGTAASSYAVVFNATNIPQQTVYGFDMTMPVEISKLYLGYVNTNTHFNANTFLKLQGSNDNATWINLNDSVAYSTTTAINGITNITGVGAVNANVFSVTKNPGRYRYYRIYWTNGGGINVNGYSNEVYFETLASYQASMNPKPSCSEDLDNDGKFNHLDLDSDGDGCSDALEANATTSTTANYTFSGPFGTNGLANSIETSTDNGIINYSSTYSPYAISKNLAGCRDTDGDGTMDIVDIDDDNDGVLDATESPSCFFSASEWFSGNREFITATTSLGMNTTYNRLNLLEDGQNGTAAANYAVQFNATTTAPATVYGFDMSMPVQLSRIYLGYVNTNTHFNANTFLKLQGSNDNASWTDLSDSIAYNTTVSIMGATSIPGLTGTLNNNMFVVHKNAAPYRYYRIYWTNGGGININGVSNEVYFETPTNYIASRNPKPSCSADIDNDGKFNHQDVDADGDKCFDAFEAGATTSKTDSTFSGPYGTNGLANSKETVADNNIINYTSTYNSYGLSSHLRSCFDNDNDGINDALDIDDDNDGITDSVENNCPLINSIVPTTSGATIGSSKVPSGWVMTGGSTDISSVSSWQGAYSHYVNGVVKNPVDNPPYGNSSTTFMTAWENGESAEAAFTMPNGGQIVAYLGGFTSSGTSGGAPASFTVDKNDIRILLSNGTILYGTGTVVQNGGWNPITFNIPAMTGTHKFQLLPSGGDNMVNLHIPGAFYSECYDTDTDNDGILNSLDLDSDNDGCKDAFEGGSTSILTDSIIAGPYGTNGLANSKETATDNGIINYVSKYSDYALSAAIKSCQDTDKDGIVDMEDIDDDNDGILDTVECPVIRVPLCFDGSFGNQTIFSITSTGCLNTVNSSPDLILPTWGSLAANTPYSPDNGAFLSFVYQKGSWDESAAFTLSNLTAGRQYRFKFYQMLVGQGPNWYDGGNILFKSKNTVIAQSANMPATNASGTGRFWQYQEVPFTADSTSMTISISGMSTNPNSAIGSRLAIDGFEIVYESSACDIDGDGIPNRLDLDSDNDGCTDAFEGGSTTNYLDTIIAGPYGTNGLANSKETATDNGTINYVSKYYDYALSSSVKYCQDADKDGIVDIDDIDDDNDGIPDLSELSCISPLNAITPTVAGANTTYGLKTANYKRLSGTVVTNATTIYNQSITALDFAATSSASITLDTAFANIKLALADIDLSESLNLKIYDNSNNLVVLNSTNVLNQGSYVNVLYTQGTSITLNAVGASDINYLTSDNSSVLLMIPNVAKRIEIYKTAGAAQTIFGIMEACDYTDSDNDGIPNQLDTDSDNDGCTDAFEGGSTTNYLDTIIAGPYGTNGLANSKETAIDNGIINYTLTYSSVTNNNIKRCLVPDFSNNTGINGNVLDLCQQAGATRTLVASPTPSGTVATIKWYSAASGGTGTTSAPVIALDTPRTVSYWASQTVSGIEGPRAEIKVVVNAKPSMSGVAILGTAIASKDSIYTHSIPVVANATAYIWTLPSGWKGNSTTNSITDTAGSVGGYIYVKASNKGCVSNDSASLLVGIKPAMPSVAQDTIRYCQNDSTIQLSATLNPSNNGGKLKWYTAQVGGTADTIAPKPSSIFSGITTYWVSQTVNGVESDRKPIVVIVNPILSPTTAINGATTVTANTSYTYKVNPVFGAVSYTWTLPNGWTGSSTVDSIVVNTNNTTSGVISVKANSVTCSGYAQTLTIANNTVVPNNPDISGNTNMVSDSIVYCQGDTALQLTASLNPTNNGGTLKWYTSPTAGVGTTTAPTPSTSSPGTFFYFVSQTVNGVESNRAAIKIVVRATPAQPTAISGATSVLANSSQVYSVSPVSGATSYTWSYSNGSNWTGTSTTATLNATAGTSAVTISVIPINTTFGKTCNGTAQTLAISIKPTMPDITPNSNINLTDSTINYCQNATALPLKVKADSSAIVKWYTSPFGGFPIRQDTSVSKTIAVGGPTPSTAFSGVFNYYVSQTLNGIESDKVAIKVIVNPTPSQPSSISGATSVAANSSQTYSISAVSGATSYQWSYSNGSTWTGSSTSTSLSATAGTSNVTISVVAIVNTNGNSCSSTAQTLVVSILPSQPDLSGNTNMNGDSIVYCQGDVASPLSASLNPANNGGTIKWYTTPVGGTASTTAPTPSTNFAGTTYYYVSQTVNGVESNRAAIKVVVKPTPSKPASIIGNTAVLANTTYIYSVNAVSGAATYTWTMPPSWTGSSTTNAITVTTDTMTTFTIKVTANFNGCSSAPATLKIGTLPSSPNSGLPGDSIVYCQGDAASQLSASLNPANNGGTLNWYTVATGGTASATAPTPNTMSAGTYYFYVSQTVNGTESDRTSIKVIVKSTPSQPTAIQGTTAVSSNTSYTYSVSAVPGATSYTWTKPNGWTGSSTTNSITLLTDTSSGTITVTANLNNCNSTAQSLIVSQMPNNPLSGLTGDSIIYCQGATATQLIASLNPSNNGGKLKWYTSPIGGTGDTIAPTPSTTFAGITYYYVSQTVNGVESSRAAIKVVVKPVPNQPNSISGPTAVSANTNYTYSVGSVAGASSYTWTLPNGWTGSSTTNSISINTSTTTSGIVTVKANLGGCSSAAQTLNVGGAPAEPDLSGNTNLVGDSIVYCQNATASQLTASLNPLNNGGTINWYTTPTGGSASSVAPTPNTSSAGTFFYYVSQTVNSVESSRAAIKIVVKPAPNQPNTISGPSSVSANTSYTYSISSVSGATSYTWTLPNGWTGTSNTTSISVTTNSITSGVIYVTANVGSCSSIAQSKVIGTLPNNPTTNMTGDSIVYCQGATASQLVASLSPTNNGGTLNWYTVASGGTASATAPTPSTLTAGTTLYYVSQTVGGVESNRTTIKVVVKPVPAQASLTTTQPTCAINTATITINAPLNSAYKYSVDSINYSLSTTFSNLASGSRKIYVKDTITGCISSIATTINAAPAAPANPTVQLTQPSCQSATGSIVISAPTGSNYIYSIDSINYQSNPTFNAVSAGTYRVRVKDISANCASDTGTKAVINSFSGTPNQPSVISGPANPSIGSTVTYSIDTVAGATSYTWTVPTGWTISSGQNTKSISVVVGSTGGTITVKANNSSGCSSAAQTLDVNKLPAKPIIDPANSNIVGNTITYCQGTVASALRADSTVSGAMIKWYTGSDSTSASNAGAIDTGSVGPIPSTAVGNTQTMYWVSQTVNGEEGIKALIIVKVNPTPSQPNAIVGNAVVLAGSNQIYSVNAVPGATSYTWTLPSGWSGTSTTNSITTTVGTLGGVVKVKANLGNCSSQEQTLTVNIKPSSPDINSNTGIVGNTITYCQGATANQLSATAISGGTLKWYDSDGTTVLSSAPTPSTDFVQLKTYYVSQIVNGVESDKVAIVVKVNSAPSQPNPIQGDTLVTKGSSKTYTVSPVPGATSYTWTLPNGWTGTSTTNSITVVADSVGGVITVKANSTNCSSPIQTLTVKVKTNTNNDADGDGIPDDVEKGSGSTPKDTDGDGIPDYQDPDSDNDGIPDSEEDSGCTGISPCTPTDTDGDGIPDYTDTDSDNDGITDNAEKGGGTTPKDTDGDGIPDYRDPDSDGDGIPDSVEKGNGTTPKDTDGDGIPDYQDSDSDNDGIPDSEEDSGCTGISPCTPTDTDGDGIPDYTDTDSDNDGITDNAEKGGGTTPKDTDGDGIPDYRDPDSDGDGIPDSVEKGNGTTPKDTDGDGIPDYLDPDSDGDGIPDALEDTGCNGTAPCTPTDTDGDGTPDYLDTDSDGDGIPDNTEDTGCNGTVPCNPSDKDGDGIPNYKDTDSDGDGIPDSVEKGSGATPQDSDGDGIPNYLDLDSDNDGILDAYENQVCPTAVVLCDTDGDGIPNYIDLDSDGDGKSDVSEAKGTDANNDGRADGTPNADGVPSSAGGGLTPPDTNLDGKTDPYDITGSTDTDGDGIPDSIEKGSGTIPIDTDGDGIPDFQDLDSDNDGILDAYENSRCSNPSILCDTDGDGVPNYLDLDSDGDGIRDVIEANGTDANNDGKADGTVDSKGVPSSANSGLTPPDSDGDGKTNPYDTDSDGDGILDSAERGSGNIPVDTDGDGKPDYLDTDSDNDGIPDSVEKGTGTTPQDTDGDGIPNHLDLDSDNDGILDAYENNVCVPSVALCDVDGDGIPNYMDLDSDNDSIPDVIESNGRDDNNDGKADGASNSKGIPSSATTGNTPPNTDALGYTDPYDLDSDNDGIPDSIEKGSNGSKPRDTDGDGIPDYRDIDSDGDGNTDQGEGEISDCDGDGIPDYLDTDNCKDDEFPNYITPNGDGKNDNFVLPASFTKKYPNAKIVIYNRWGNIVWRSVGVYKNDWNGVHYDNEVLPDGVYYYVIELENEFAKIKTGFVQILRD